MAIAPQSAMLPAPSRARPGLAVLSPIPRPVWTLVRIAALIGLTSAVVAIVLAVVLTAAYALATTLQS